MRRRVGTAGNKKREVSERNALENLASSTEVDIGESLSAFYKLELF
ncbi:MAG: hypothetical protein K2I74_09210 [Treponemataceae bacterium]|nr:hypothetical protein [Treponemataceae bacterium]